MSNLGGGTADDGAGVVRLGGTTPLTHSHTLTHTLTLSHTHIHTLTLSHTHTLSHFTPPAGWGGTADDAADDGAGVVRLGGRRDARR